MLFHDFHVIIINILCEVDKLTYSAILDKNINEYAILEQLERARLFQFVKEKTFKYMHLHILATISINH